MSNNSASEEIVDLSSPVGDNIGNLSSAVSDGDNVISIYCILYQQTDKQTDR